MTRLELIRLIVGRARLNGFEFRRWYTTRLELPWISSDAALRLLDTQRRYYALIFSHEFALAFWKPGSEITFDVPAQSFQRVMPDGSPRTIARKSFIRRSVRPEAWRYHLRQMAAADEPLRYLRKYLHVEDQLDSDSELPLQNRSPSPRKHHPTPKHKVPAKSAGKTSGPVLPKSAAHSIAKPGTKTAAQKGVTNRALPADLPAFLKRPYPARLQPTPAPEEH